MRPRPLEFWLGLWTLLLVAAAAGVLVSEHYQSQGSTRDLLTLTAADQGQRIRIDWDPANPQVQAAESGVLEVLDGEAFHRYPVEKKVLLNGGLDYLRKSPEVLLTLTLLRGGQPADRATVRTIGAVTQALLDPAEEPEAANSTSRSRRRR